MSMETMDCEDELHLSQSSALAHRIIERQRDNLTKGTIQIYDCYVKGFLQFCIAQGYTSIYHKDAIFRTAQQPPLTAQYLIENQIRPVACAQYLKEYMPIFIAHGRKQRSRAHQKQGRADQEPASAVMIEAVLKSVSKTRQFETEIVDMLRTSTAWWTPEQQAFYDRFASVRDNGNNEFRTAATTTTADERREHHTDPLIESPQAGFSLDDLAEFSEWTLIQRDIDFFRAFTARTIILFNFAAGTRCKNLELLDFEYLCPTNMSARTLPTLEPITGIDVMTDKSKMNQVGRKHVCSIAVHRQTCFCSVASLAILEICRFLPRDKGGYGHPYFDFTAIKSYFGVPVIASRDSHDRKPMGEKSVRALLTDCLTAFFRSKGMPEWYIDMYKTQYLRHLGRHLTVLQLEAAGVDGELQDRHCKFATGRRKAGPNNQRVNHYANMTGCRSTALTLAGTHIYGGFQPDEPLMLGPLPDRELCIEISPEAYRQEEFLNDFGSRYWQNPDAQVNARECAVKINKLFTDILTPVFVRCLLEFQKVYPSLPLFDSERMGWILERPLFRSYAEHVAAFKLVQTPTPACSAQETMALAAVTQSTSACLLSEMRLMRSEQSAFHTEVRRRLSALETRPSNDTQSRGLDFERTLEQDTNTFEEERREGQVTDNSPASDDLFTRFKLDHLESMLNYLPELALLDRYRKQPSSGDGFGRVLDWWQNGWRVSSSDQSFPPASDIVECYGENFTQRTVACLPPEVERKPAQVMLRNRLSNLLDTVQYLRHMAQNNGSGHLGQRMRALATRLDGNRPAGLSLAAFVRILKAANAAYTELHEIINGARSSSLMPAVKFGSSVSNCY